jgi:hypothetical protein
MFPGIFSLAAGEGTTDIYYIELRNGLIPYGWMRSGGERVLRSCFFDGDYQTNNSFLLSVWFTAMHHPLPFFTLDEIRQMGWVDFVIDTLRD